MPEATQPSPRPATARIDLKLGFSCNNRCRFCVQGDKRARLPELTTAEAVARLAEARAHAEDLVFTGGEVTIRRDLPELVAEARRLGFRRIQIQTNGRALAYGATLARLVAAGATEFSPALHGHTAAVGILLKHFLHRWFLCARLVGYRQAVSFQLSAVSYQLSAEC